MHVYVCNLASHFIDVMDCSYHGNLTVDPPPDPISQDVCMGQEREGERERERKRGREREGEKEREGERGRGRGRDDVFNGLGSSNETTAKVTR